MNFWQQLPKPFFALAPMDDVTDVAFRQIVARAAAPEVLFTEFVATDGLQSAGRERTMERLRIEPDLDRPLVIQIWGSNPNNYYKTARDIAAINAAQAAAGLPGFAGIDINMGCPEKSIVARGCCGGMIGNDALAAELIAATKEGARAAADGTDLPVSVKTRIGLNTIITESWASALLRQDLAALTIHGRTVREMSKVPARWDEVAKVVALRDELAPGTVIIGNGDARDRAHGEELAAASGADGVMIGRGIFADLFCFAPAPAAGGAPRVRTPDQMLDILLGHLDLYEQWGSTKPFQTLKKFFKIYVYGWPNAAELRTRFMEARTPDEVRAIITEYRAAIRITPTI